MAKKKFPEIKEKNEGKFTAWVEPSVVKMANYAKNFGCSKK